MTMNKIITEITPLSDKDCFYLIDRHKQCFDYPIHRHNEYELNFVSNCKGCRRVVGDSIEVLDEYDLALIGPGLEHGWEQNGAKTEGNMREITVQFNLVNASEEFLKKNQLAPIRELFGKAPRGVAFSQATIRSLLDRFDMLTQPQPGFLRFLRLLEILYELAVSKDPRELSTSSFANIHFHTADSRRVQRVEEYINNNYAGELRLADLASLANMTPTAFSRFFKARTGRTLSDYIVDIRIGHAARRLVDTTMTSAEICYESGFNNISNFNRLFRKKKGCSPKEFRENYLKTRIII